MTRYSAALPVLLSLLTATAAPFRGGPAIDGVINEAIRTDRLPGAVVLVGHKDEIVYQKVYGNRATVPAREAMTANTVFDVASLTKVVATTSAMMRLVEQGKVRMNEKVTTYLPAFQGGISDITVRNLLTHYSGMRPDLDLEPEWSGYETGIAKVLADRPGAAPETRFTYSDINFILLGEIVRQVSGKSLPDFVREEVFEPLGMKDTMFTPPASLRGRIAPTEVWKGQVLRGLVHDPTSRFMGGIAGHAGLFSTAADLARFARMMLRGGELDGVRIFSPLTVEMFTSPASPAGKPDVRGLGWDIDSRFSGNRGDLFPVGSYGHTGFTGTSIWVDPASNSFVIMLSNSVHPKLRLPVTSIRGRVASAAAAGLDITRTAGAAPRRSVPSVPAETPSRQVTVKNGIDVLAEGNYSALQGKRVGLITNHTGLTLDGKRNIDAMLAGGVNLRALYSPEHGIAGREDKEDVGHEKDAASGLPVWSLYEGKNRRPDQKMLAGIDVLVFDIQDIGTRFYTYMCTMKNALEEAAKQNIEFMLLDRPNPINGVTVEGPLLEPTLQSFVGCMDIPLRHGMTMGELATMTNASAQPKARLTVVKMQGWDRNDWFDSVGQKWVDPSPNMRSLNAALLYPGIGMFEYTKVYSVGRGTDAPFEQIGADWIQGQKLAAYLNGRAIPGIRVYPTVIRPTASNFMGKTIEGIRFVITDRNTFRSVRFGIELAVGLEKLFPAKMTWGVNEKLTGSTKVLSAISKGSDSSTVVRLFEADTEAFHVRRQAFLLY
ncbi:MAG: DUF1343 domain-containing protein [Bryobacteraceae bacterium]|nr:DUF1343 domain-containing protein [Bryobacteraceae bacterium]